MYRLCFEMLPRRIGPMLTLALLPASHIHARIPTQPHSESTLCLARSDSIPYTHAPSFVCLLAYLLQSCMLSHSQKMTTAGRAVKAHDHVLNLLPSSACSGSCCSFWMSCSAVTRCRKISVQVTAGPHKIRVSVHIRTPARDSSRTHLPCPNAARGCRTDTCVSKCAHPAASRL